MEYPTLPQAFTSMAEALLVGVLFGAQREAVKEGHRPGIRDFIMIALAGGLCGLLEQWVLTLTTLAIIGGVLVTGMVLSGWLRGITTELAAVLTFCLAYVLAVPQYKESAPLAIGVTVVAVFALEAKSTIHRFVRETITPVEFTDTLRFLAVVLVVYPVLPDASYGPYGFFAPRRVWLFVILVSSISFTGYFLQKFFGEKYSRNLVAVLGGLASTTAATAAFSKDYAQDRTKTMEYWHATTLTNAVQMPRLLVIVAVLAPAAVGGLWRILVVMGAAGLAMAAVLAKRCPSQGDHRAMPMGNPFRLAPALTFGLLFTAIQFLAGWTTAKLGNQGAYWSAALGGSIDSDAVVISLIGLSQTGGLPQQVVQLGVLIALLANAVLKTGLAFYGGGPKLGWRLAASFALIFAAGGAALMA
jgi:uncharacterized membrane protein (DUF4010 family)